MIFERVRIPEYSGVVRTATVTYNIVDYAKVGQRYKLRSQNK